MAVSRIETTIVLGLLGCVVAVAGIGASYILTAPPREVAAQLPVKPTAAAPASMPPTVPSSPPAPFIATVDNEMSWYAGNLPVDWPSFTKLPDEKPLATKPTKAKIDAAKAIIEKWSAYLNQSNKTSDFPASKDASLAIKYLLTIPRNDPAFPDAWATFIRLREVDREIGREIGRLEAAKVREKEVADRKRIAKTQGVVVGMTKEEVLGSNWGKPRSVNITTTRYGDHEQWVYGGGYLYFDNDRLTSIQTSR